MRKIKSNFKKVEAPEFLVAMSKEILFYGKYKEYPLVATIEENEETIISLSSKKESFNLSDDEILEIMKKLNLENYIYETWEAKSPFGHTKFDIKFDFIKLILKISEKISLCKVCLP